MSETKHDIMAFDYKDTFHDFFIGDEASPSELVLRQEAQKASCTNGTEKRVRTVSGVEDEAWYDQCAMSAYPSTGPERMEETKRPPYTKLWTAQRVNNWRD